MKARSKLAESTTPEGAPMALYEHDGAYSISFKGQELMHSKACASEQLLGELGIERLSQAQAPRVMIGGLGLGFTLQAVLAGLGPQAQVEVVELVPKVVEWNRDFLRDLNGALLDDPRVTVTVADALPLIRKAHANYYDALILDVDNGPSGMVKASNRSLYSHNGLRAVLHALKPGGRAAFWSAGEDPHFKMRLKQRGFRVGGIRAKVHERAKRAAYMIYVADKADASRGR
jgi:spermidine synthase